MATFFLQYNSSKNTVQPVAKN